MQVTWRTKSFAELTNTEVYDILQLRQLIFIVEQNCPYLDADNKDRKSHHLMGYDGEKLVAYTRLIPKGISYDNEPSIGRVVTHPDTRRTGVGIELMQQSVKECHRLFGEGPIRIGAQKWLEKFYNKTGFMDAGLPQYYEDGIVHIIMLRK